MSDDIRARADARLEAALSGAPIRDPRPYFRPVLKHLRERNPSAFEQALAHYEGTVVPAVAAGADALEEWLGYGRMLAELLGPGSAMTVDGTGRATPAGDAPPAGTLVLHLPDSAEVPAMVLRCPAETTAAQDASIELLVLGRVTLGG